METIQKRIAKHGSATINLTAAVKSRANTPSGNWPPPTCSDAFTDKMKSSQRREGSMHSVNLSQAVRIWRTPTVGMLNADRAKDPEYHARKVAKGQTITLADEVKTAEGGGSLNPDWVEWLMGWPLYWTSLEKIPIFAYQQWQDETGNWKEAGATDVPDEAMRNVWWSNDPSAAPRGWECDEQRSGQCESALSKVPHEGSHDDRELGARGSEDCGLPCLWEEFQTEENEAGEAVWKCGVCQRTRPKVGRVAMGITSRVDRLKAIGNGQVPAVVRLAWNTLYERIQSRVNNG